MTYGLSYLNLSCAAVKAKSAGLPLRSEAQAAVQYIRIMVSTFAFSFLGIGLHFDPWGMSF
jgi:hypothetical protein